SAAPSRRPKSPTTKKGAQADPSVGFVESSRHGGGWLKVDYMARMRQGKRSSRPTAGGIASRGYGWVACLKRSQRCELVTALEPQPSFELLANVLVRLRQQAPRHQGDAATAGRVTRLRRAEGPQRRCRIVRQWR